MVSFSYLFNSIVYLVGIHSIIFTYIPSFTNNVDILYNGIILYSNIKHFLENKYLYIKKKLYIFNIIDCKKYLFIEKNMIFNIFYKDIKSLLFINNNFLVYKDTIIGDVNYINNYVFYFEHPEHFIYEYCTFKFISINITLNGDKKYNLKLTDDTNNYFIVDNKLNKYSLSYLLSTQQGIIIGNTPYVLEIIDHNVKIFTITEMDELVFDLNTYTVKKYEEKYYDEDDVEDDVEEDNNVEDDDVEDDDCDIIDKNDCDIIDECKNDINTGYEL